MGKAWRQNMRIPFYAMMGMLLFGVAGWLLPEIRSGASAPDVVGAGLAVAAAMLIGATIGLGLGTVAHELGHWLFGRRNGMRLEAFELFGCRLSEEHGRWRLKRSGADRSARGMLGGVSMQPRETVSAAGLIAHYRGGYLMNALIAVISGVGSALLGGLPGAALFGGSIINGYLAWTNAMCLCDELIYTDGDLIRLVRTQGTAMVAMMRATAEIYSGKRPGALETISVSSDERLLAVMQAMLAFLQASDVDDAKAAGEVIGLIRESDAPVLNIDPIERRAYAVIYDSWLSPDTGRLYAGMNADFGLLRRDDRPMSNLARFFERCYRYEHSIVPVPTRDEIEADREMLLSAFSEAANRGMAIWACELIKRRELGINRRVLNEKV